MNIQYSEHCIEEHFDVPNRRHKRKRIQKKYFKKFGHKIEFPIIYDSKTHTVFTHPKNKPFIDKQIEYGKTKPRGHLSPITQT